MYDANVLQSKQCETLQLNALTMRENMEQAHKRAQAEVQRTAEILSLLEKNPDFERLLTLLGNRNY